MPGVLGRIRDAAVRPLVMGILEKGMLPPLNKIRADIGAPPVASADLASWDFWAQDDDFRDGAFATLRREAPIAFHQELTQ
jgi:hypothetical protein